MSKKSLLVVLLLAVLLIGVVAPVAAQEPVTITWFVGLGTGTNSEQIEIQNQVVADFNATHDNIELVINIAASNETSRDTLSTLLAAGTPPDIVGPVGVAGSNSFADQWATNIDDLAADAGFDTSVFDPALIDLYRTEDGGLAGLPFAVYPAVTYYNEDLFDEAGLNYPPAEFGAPYVMPDGTEVAWSYDTAAEIAKILTVDANGNDATMEGFDPSAIEQFGLNFQWARIRLIWTDLQPATWYDAETNTVTVPEEWRQASQWYWDRIWTDRTAPNATLMNSEILQPSGFASGNLAMSIVPLWYTCCLDNSVGNFNWDIAPVPASFDGEQHVAMDADTFRLVAASAHPAEAFEVLTYLVTEAAPVLASAYGAYPALPAAQPAWVEAISARYPLGVNWDVAAASLAYANPGPVHHESNLPNYTQVYDREFQLLSLIEGDTGADIDLNAEIDAFEADVNTIVQSGS
ncbi:MAG: extracellular solute-binding protein [Anaerolinea sp.]|nr:extracellular solute-binding protein [Anaerolinea sp.]